MEPPSILQATRHQPVDQDQLLRQFVQGRDVPCPTCGYNLRNALSTRCPECGHELTLDVAARRRAKLGPAAFWTVFAAAGPLGVYLTGLVMISVAVLRDMRMYRTPYRPSPADVRLAGALAVASAVFAVLLWVGVRLREWLNRQRAVRRWTVALAWTVVLVLAHASVMQWLLRVID